MAQPSKCAIKVKVHIKAPLFDAIDAEIRAQIAPLAAISKRITRTKEQDGNPRRWTVQLRSVRSIQAKAAQ